MKVFKKYLKGSVTIEYTLLLPVLLAVYTFLIAMAIYQYNECLLMSNLYIIGNQRMELARLDGEEQVNLLKGRTARLYYEKYILVEVMQTKYSIKRKHIEITGIGKMRNPLAVIGIGNEEWTIRARCEQDVLDAVGVLRVYKNIGDQLRFQISKEESRK